MVKIAIVDYGIGNLRSIKTSLEAVGSEIIITNKRDGIDHRQTIGKGDHQTQDHRGHRRDAQQGTGHNRHSEG